MPQTASNSQTVSATTFVIQVTGVPIATFSELGGISSEVEAVEYIASTSSGGVSHSKLYGKTSPPTITLKRGLDNSMALWAWHQRVRAGDPGAPVDCTLQLCGPDGRPQVTYLLHSAWPRKVEVTSATAGQGMVFEQVTLVCDQIEGKEQ